MQKIIFQINVPNHFELQKLSAYSYMEEMYAISERNARNYANRVGADYYKVEKADDFSLASHKHLDYQKLKMYDFLNYDRIVYFDSDYIIKNNAPNLFELCNNDFSAVIDNGKTVPILADNLGIPKERYFNAGFMFLTKELLIKTKDFLEEYLEKEYEYQGQGLLNKLFYDKNIKCNELPADLWNPIRNTFGLYADHYAGGKKKKWNADLY